jgi:hypothetical protein
MVITSSSDDGKSPTSNVKKRKSKGYGVLSESQEESPSKFFDLEAVVSRSESEDEQDDGEGVGSFIVSDHESVPASTQQVVSQDLEDTQQVVSQVWDRLPLRVMASASSSVPR